MSTVRQQSNYNNYFKDMNDYFVIDKTTIVSEFLLTDNFKKSRKKVSSYDFETLYTHIPHNQLKINVKKSLFLETFHQRFSPCSFLSNFLSDFHQTWHGDLYNLMAH